MTMAIKLAVPPLRIADVARSMEWYRGTLGFVGDPFPAEPPYEFALLRQGQVELMLRRGSPPVRPQLRQYDWDVYLRREGSRFREVYATFSARGIVTRQLEQCSMASPSLKLRTPMVMLFASASNLKMQAICQFLPLRWWLVTDL